MDSTQDPETTRAGSGPGTESPWPTNALLAGEEGRDDEPHIHRGID
ncbi:hypothetical protein [Streptomyces fuscigenes]|nr:hypothetical protein [Streptomyces fuscigenes]MCF3960679.1 hypothetical protein [Streptomyces fuscigenes]